MKTNEAGLARMNELGKLILGDKNYFKLPNLRPKDAATLIVIDRAGPVPKVLLGKRHHGHKFMPGKYVFPGGGVEPADKRMPVARGRSTPTPKQRLMRAVKRPSPVKARALALAAIRETYEETGLILGVPGPAATHARRALGDVREGAHPSRPRAVHFIARAITPPRRPKRFDTRFFAVDASAIAHRIDGIIGPDAELVELVWMPIAEARQLDMPAITGVVLEELEVRIAHGFGHDLPVPFYQMRHRRFVRELL